MGKCERTLSHESGHGESFAKHDILMGRTWCICSNLECQNDKSFDWPCVEDEEHALLRRLFAVKYSGRRPPRKKQKGEEQGPWRWDGRHLALAMIPVLESAIAWDIEESSWRVWTGCGWQKDCARQASAIDVLANALHKHLGQLDETLSADLESMRDGTNMGASLRNEADVREAQRACQKLLERSGQMVFVREVLAWVQPRLGVESEKWNRRLKGCLPVRQGLLQWAVEGKDLVRFEPHAFDAWVRAERIMPVDWRGPEHGDARLNDLLGAWFRDDEQRESWLQTMAYALSRTATREVFVTVVGPPSCGKSSFFRLIQAVFGTESVLMRPDCSMVARPARATRTLDTGGTGHDTNAMACWTRALAVFCEPRADSVLRQAQLKSWTGDDVSGRLAHSATVRSMPRVFTPFLVGNCIPKLEDATDQALKRRHHMLEMGTVFAFNTSGDGATKAARPADMEYCMNDQSVASALLALMSQAWVSLVHGKFQLPETDRARALKEDYWKEASQRATPIDVFVEVAIRFEAGTKTRKAEVFEKYKSWCADKEVQPWKEVEFYRKMHSVLLGHQQQSGVLVRLDVRLSDEKRSRAYEGISLK